MEFPKCKVCNSQTKIIFETKVLNKYDVSYFKCKKCKFIQTEEPYWLEEAYNNAIAIQDIGLIFRNNYFADILYPIITFYYNRKKRFIDFGGGYGIFTRVMRDAGFNFFRFDKYCENLFARDFDDNDYENYELLTAFEVFEHLTNPLSEIEFMLKKSTNLFFSTEIHPDLDFKNANEWWYFMPWTGQHVALYSRESLEYIAKKYQLNYYTNGKNFHLFTKKKLNKFLFNIITKRKIAKLIKLFSPSRTLLNSDYDNLLEKSLKF